MTHPQARLAYLTIPEPGLMLLNIVTEQPIKQDNGLLRIALTRGQIRGILLEGMKEMLK